MGKGGLQQQCGEAMLFLGVKRPAAWQISSSFALNGGEGYIVLLLLLPRSASAHSVFRVSAAGDRLRPQHALA